MDLSIDAGENPEFVLISGEHRGGIEWFHRGLLLDARRERPGKEISCRSEERTQSGLFRPQWPGIIAFIAVQSQRSSGRTSTENPRQIHIEQVILPRHQ